MQNIALAIAENLDLNVTGSADVALEKHGAVSERCSRFPGRFFETAFELCSRFDHAHAAPAASESRFNDQREADFLGCFANLVESLDGLLRAGNDGDTRSLGQAARRSLVA